jgi:hypothetical protein
MSRWMFIGLGLAVTLGGLALYSCTMDDGGRCQLNADCASGYCCKGAAAELSTDGFCAADEAACNAHFGLDGGDTVREDSRVEAEAEAEAEAEVEEEAEAEVDDTTDVVEDVPDVVEATPEATPDSSPDAPEAD